MKFNSKGAGRLLYITIKKKVLKKNNNYSVIKTLYSKGFFFV